MKTMAVSGINIDMKHHRPMPDFIDGVLYQIVEPWYEQLKVSYPANIFNLTRTPLYSAIQDCLRP